MKNINELNDPPKPIGKKLSSGEELAKLQKVLDMAKKLRKDLEQSFARKIQENKVI